MYEIFAVTEYKSLDHWYTVSSLFSRLAGVYHIIRKGWIEYSRLDPVVLSNWETIWEPPHAKQELGMCTGHSPSERLIITMLYSNGSIKFLLLKTIWLRKSTIGMFLTASLTRESNIWINELSYMKIYISTKHSTSYTPNFKYWHDHNLLGNLVKLTIHIIAVLLLLVFWWVLLIDELRKWADSQLRWRLQEHRPWHSRHLLIHSGSVKNTLVFPIAQNLQTTIIS